MTLTWYIGNSEEILKTIPTESVDFIITSPPYNIGKDYGIYKDNLLKKEYYIFIDHILKECHRIVKNDGRIAFNIPHVIKSDIIKHFPILNFTEIMIKNGFNIREIIYWFKTKGEEQVYQTNSAWGSWKSASNPHLRGLIEPIIIANKNSWKKTSGSGISDITVEEFQSWTKSAWFINGDINKDHPAPFPIDIPTRLIKLYTFVNDTILDPFVGTGTTLRACEILGRNGIGIDLNSEYKNNYKNINFEFKEIKPTVYEMKEKLSIFDF